MNPPSFKSSPLLHKEIPQAVRHLANPKLFEQAQGDIVDPLHIRNTQGFILPAKPAGGRGIYRQGFTAPQMSPRSATCCARHNTPFDYSAGTVPRARASVKENNRAVRLSNGGKIFSKPLPMSQE
jgi:hypothetical protein